MQLANSESTRRTPMYSRNNCWGANCFEGLIMYRLIFKSSERKKFIFAHELDKDLDSSRVLSFFLCIHCTTTGTAQPTMKMKKKKKEKLRNFIHIAKYRETSQYHIKICIFQLNSTVGMTRSKSVCKRKSVHKLTMEDVVIDNANPVIIVY